MRRSSRVTAAHTGACLALAGLAALLGGACVLSFTDYPPTNCTPSDGAVFAVDHLFIGDEDMNGVPSTTAWTQYGANIDGQVATTDLSMHCTPNSGATPSQAFANGVGGIDNSFGHNLVPILQQFSPTLSNDVNAGITSGQVGYLVDVVGLTRAPNQPNLTARFYSGAPLAKPPTFDGNDCWPVDGATVTNIMDVKSAKDIFTGGSLANNVWTSGPPQTLLLNAKFQSNALVLTLHHAVIKAELSVDHQSVILGQISGVLNTDELISAVAQLTPGLCGSQLLTSIETQIRQASDIMTDGTQNPNAVCDGISIGLGFTAKPASLGGVGHTSPPAISCP